MNHQRLDHRGQAGEALATRPARGLGHALSALLLVAAMLSRPAPAAAAADGEWEITKESDEASRQGLEWLAKYQGEGGNWESNDLGLVSLGALAFLSAGHLPDRGKYGDHVRKALDYVITRAKPSGLLNITEAQHDMYNHGLAMFVLTQAYGMTSDKRLGPTIDKGVKLIVEAQCEDGGWDYKAVRQKRGHDLSLAVMQAKALRGAMDMGLEIPQRSVDLAIRSVREHYKAMGKPDGKNYGTDPLADRPGGFTYEGSRYTTAMGAAGAVCLQEFGLYSDFRIHRSMDMVADDIDKRMKTAKGQVPFDAYTMYYVAQGLYQVGGKRWETYYPKIRDATVQMQSRGKSTEESGYWDGGRVGGRPGRLFGTSVAVFTLNIPNRYLPILQRGEAEPGKDAKDPKEVKAGAP